MNRPQNDDERQREANAILQRIRQETEPQIGAHSESTLLRPRAHFTAADVDPSDRIEVIGTRIGRAAGLVGFIVFALLLFTSMSGH